MAALRVIRFFPKSDKNMGLGYRPKPPTPSQYTGLRPYWKYIAESSASKELLSNRPQFTNATKL